jgi:hypothetical protein
VAIAPFSFCNSCFRGHPLSTLNRRFKTFTLVGNVPLYCRLVIGMPNKTVNLLLYIVSLLWGHLVCLPLPCLSCSTVQGDHKLLNPIRRWTVLLRWATQSIGSGEHKHSFFFHFQTNKDAVFQCAGNCSFPFLYIPWHIMLTSCKWTHHFFCEEWTRHFPVYFPKNSI